ncbi:hypothetical protein [Bradyrhizobium sp.]|uniref:hypothetical protein n=1 Tax=Bradyrhizobium sp. TaxID=376 RepID=UPI003C4CB0F3
MQLAGKYACWTTMALIAAVELPAPACAAQLTPLIVAQASPTPAPVQPPATTTSPSQAPTTTVAPAEKSALSTPACSVKYLEAKVSGKLQGRKWVDFRRDECGKRETTAVFPTAIAPKYENEKDLDKARTKTCADQFTANKATKANGGLVWIEKDGGYYAECIIRLKG